VPYSTRNCPSANTDRYDRPEYGYRATGIQLANEGSWAGWSLRNVRITNNIVEWVSQGIRYWHSRSGGDIHDTYGGLYVGFNTVNRTQFSRLRFDTPDGWWPASGSRLRQNLILNTSGNSWFSTENWGSWTVGGNWNYSNGTSSSSPGIKDTWGTYASAYELRSGAAIHGSVAPWSESDMPSTDYNCQSRGQGHFGRQGCEHQQAGAQNSEDQPELPGDAAAGHRQRSHCRQADQS